MTCRTGTTKHKSSSPRIYTNDSITFLTTIYTLLINVLARSRLHSIIVLHTLAAPFWRRNRVITVKKWLRNFVQWHSFQCDIYEEKMWLVITEFLAMTFISMRHLRRKNVIGQNQKEPEIKKNPNPNCTLLFSSYLYQRFHYISHNNLYTAD